MTIELLGDSIEMSRLGVLICSFVNDGFRYYTLFLQKAGLPLGAGYPLPPDEAFLASQFDSFITADLVMQARKTTDIQPYGPLIVGVDPAGKGADATAIAFRRGHCIVKVEKRRGLSTMEVAGWVAKIIRDDKPAKVNVDLGGFGTGTSARPLAQAYIS